MKNLTIKNIFTTILIATTSIFSFSQNYFSLEDTVFHDGAIFKMDSVEFDFGKVALRPHSKIYLNKVAQFCIEHPYLVLEVRSHTDYRGDDDYNLKLSERRALITQQYLISLGANDHNVFAKGFGETLNYSVRTADTINASFIKPSIVINKEFIQNLNDPNHQEYCHQLNRRTELVILKNYKNSGLLKIDSALFFSGDKIVVPNITFKLAKSILMRESYLQLDELVSFMKKYPSVVMEVSNHSDCRVSKHYSTILSEKRAQSIVSYLIDQGIDAARLIAKGYEDQVPFEENGLVYSCEYINTVESRDEQEFLHQKNRRTEIRIISNSFEKKN